MKVALHWWTHARPGRKDDLPIRARGRAAEVGLTLLALRMALPKH